VTVATTEKNIRVGNDDRGGTNGVKGKLENSIRSTETGGNSG